MSYTHVTTDNIENEKFDINEHEINNILRIRIGFSINTTDTIVFYSLRTVCYYYTFDEMFNFEENIEAKKTARELLNSRDDNNTILAAYILNNMRFE